MEGSAEVCGRIFGAGAENTKKATTLNRCVWCEDGELDSHRHRFEWSAQDDTA